MGTLSYPVIYGDWSGTINLNYTTAYDPKKNQTTITFKTCSAVYSSRADYQTSTDTEITVAAGDNSGSSGTLTLHTEGYGTGGTVTFTGTPSPASITVQHAAGAGAKTVSLSASTTAAVRPYSGSSLVYAGGSGAVSETSATAYTLSKNQGSGSTLSVTVYSSPFRSEGENISNGGVIFAGEKLMTVFSAQAGYHNVQCNVSGVGAINSGGTFTVSGDTTITTSAIKIPYTLSYQVGKGVVLTITRNGAALSSGDTIYYGDSLNISFSAQPGYEVKSAILNESEITSPYTHEVTESVDLTIVTVLLSSVWIYVNGTFKRYFINIFIQGAWRRHREKIFPGGGMEQQAICGQALCGTIKCGGDT